MLDRPPCLCMVGLWKYLPYSSQRLSCVASGPHSLLRVSYMMAKGLDGLDPCTMLACVSPAFMFWGKYINIYLRVS